MMIFKITCWSWISSSILILAVPHSKHLCPDFMHPWTNHVFGWTPITWNRTRPNAICSCFVLPLPHPPYARMRFTHLLDLVIQSTLLDMKIRLLSLPMLCFIYSCWRSGIPSVNRKTFIRLELVLEYTCPLSRSSLTSVLAKNYF